jgi:hypothetical protein
MHGQLIAVLIKSRKWKKKWFTQTCVCNSSLLIIIYTRQNIVPISFFENVFYMLIS